MRNFEIILKIAFLAGSIVFLFTKDFNSVGFLIFLIVCAVLGCVLVVNKDSSYHYPQTPRDLVIRKIEGILLVVFSIITFIYA